MKIKKVIYLAMLVAIMVAAGAFTAVFADDDDSTFKVINLSNRDVRIEVYGYADATYGESDSAAAKIFIAPAGGSAEVLLDNDDTYYYFYAACGPNPATDAYDGSNPPQSNDLQTTNVISGVIDMKDDVSITIYPCDAQPTVMQVKNHLAETVTLKISGYEEFDYEIEPGFNIVKLYSGQNFYNYDACDQDFNGVVDVLANGKTQFFLRSCEWHASPARVHGEPNPVNFTIVNHATFPMILTLIGPENYLVTINPGENRLQLVAGSYDYSYYMDFEKNSGGFFVPETGNGRVMFSPEYTIDYGVVESEFE